MKYKIKITDNQKKEINISEDEIIEVKYNIGLTEKNDYANNRSSVEMEITGKIISNLENTDSLNSGINNDLYEKNKKNVIELVSWSESYLGDNDYRNIEVDVDLGSDKKINYKFSDMFVHNFFQELSIEKGIGLFVIKLKQKFHQNHKIEIK